MFMTNIFSRFKKKKLRKTTGGKINTILTAAKITTFLDVGANIGQTYDKLRSSGFTGKIISFEPVPSAHKIITDKSQNDPLWIITPRMALGSENTEAKLNISQNTDMSSLLNPSNDLLKALPKTNIIDKVMTDIRTLDSLYDDYCSPNDNIFLKMDTQGFEREVLNGAANSIKKIKGIQMELSLFSLYEGEETYLGFLNDLHQWGFSPKMIIETNFSYPLKKQLQIDVIFIKD